MTSRDSVHEPVHVHPTLHPHLTPSPRKIAELDTGLPAELLVLLPRLSPERRWMPGLPEVETLESELRRRQSAGQAVVL